MSAPDNRMESYLQKTLKKIKNAAPRKLKDLRDMCDDLCEALSNNQRAGGDREDSDADKFFEPLQAACESRLPKLMEIALDAIHFLIEHGYLRGNKRLVVSELNTSSSAAEPDIKPSQRRTLMDLIIETICKCSEEFDDTVHLQVIKALLMAITCQYCQVHEASLLLAVRSCFHIHLITKNQINKTTAKAALTQMLSVVFQRMEAFDRRTKLETEAALAALGKENDDDTSLSVPCGQSMFPEVYAALGYKPAGPVPTPFAGFGSSAVQIGHIFPSILHKDAFLIFRALCKLSNKGKLDENENIYDPITLQNKILSLELILHVLLHSGPAFKTGDKFIYVIKHYLCASLLNNCTSHIPQVTGLALHVFVALLDGFKDHLKHELEIFITYVFLRILDSENSTFEHKSKVLEVFHQICREPSAQVELFINYDCDFEAIDLYRRMVDAFAKIAKNPVISRSSVDFISSSKKAATEEHILRSMGLQGLVQTLRSLLKLSNINLPGEVVAASPNSHFEKAKGTSSTRLLQEISEPTVVAEEVKQVSENDDDFSIDQSLDEIKDDGQKIMQSYDRKQKIQEEIETGILKFNLSSKKGLAYLASKGHIEYTPTGVARFFKQYQDRLDKTVIGDYLGREREYENGFCVKVLHEFVDAMDFTDMHFEEAIRYFLSGFRLPGEAQKIDRMMEKFAERYYLQNRKIFASADLAFILAFSTIMLQTNLHNPAIKDDKRMTKEQFIRQNKGISSDGEIPDYLLSEIYDRIAMHPIALHQDEKTMKKLKKEEYSVFNLGLDKKRKEAFNDERKEMVRSTEALFKQKLRVKRPASAYLRAAQSDEAYVRPMFEVSWAAMLSVFSQTFEMCDDADLIELCLEGLHYAIRLAGRLDIPVARDAYVNALAKFTTLDTVREMRTKNIRAIQLLIEVCIGEGDYMLESWGQLLRCLSQLARLQLLGNGMHSDDMFFSDPSNKRGRAANGADSFSKLFSGPTKAEMIRTIEEANAVIIIRDIDPVLIDRIFLHSQNFSSESVQHFVSHLCAVSILEISVTSNYFRGKDNEVSSAPRVFSLQKLVEVADFNMYSRPRIAWANMWSVLALHFTTVGIHENHALAMYAIDSLKQLSIKFLQKDELSNFNFQRLFLKPFEIIMSKSNSTEIKELILRCIDIMVKACAGNIRSGWRSIFSVFSVAAGDDEKEISSLAFDITERLMTQQFDLLIFDFVELMNCLVCFVAGVHTDIALSALGHLSHCADHLAQGTVEPAIEAQHTSSDTMGISWEKSRLSTQIDEDGSVFRLWWPLLLGLATRVADNRLDVRSRALETLHRVLKTYGQLFSVQTWEVIFKGVLFPMMDNAKTDATAQPVSQWPTQNPGSTKDPSSWIGTTAVTVLSVILQLFTQFKRTGLTTSFLPDIVSMLEGCINQEIESLARMSLSAFSELIMSFSGDEVIDVSAIDLAYRRFSKLLLKHLPSDFGECGELTCDDLVPSDVSALLDVGRVKSVIEYENVVTPFGVGRTVKGAGANVKQVITLTWGAVLYSYDKYPAAATQEPESTMMLPKLTKEQEWYHTSASCMTSMTLTLDFIRTMGEMIHMYYNIWTTAQMRDLLLTLETCYHHARCFNEDAKLRLHLKNHNFMKFRHNPQKLPHLLEQESQSSAQLLVFLFRMLEEETEEDIRREQAAVAEQILRRLLTIMFDGYMCVDEESLKSEDAFISEQLTAYGPPIIISLRGISNMTPVQFKRNALWITPLLAKIIVCSDRAIRMSVKSIYDGHIYSVIEAHCNVQGLAVA